MSTRRLISDTDQERKRRRYTAAIPFTCWDCTRFFIVPLLVVAAVAILLAWFNTDSVNGDNTLYALIDRLNNNVTIQLGLLYEKTFNLMSKDMVLMDNVTDLDAKIDALNLNSTLEIDQLIAKDMILMDNVTALDARLTQESSDRATKDMILMDNVTALDGRVSVLESDVSNIESTIMSLELKDMGLMNNQTMLQAEIQNLYTDSMMQQAQLDALVTVGEILNQTDVNITEKLGELMMDAIALSTQLDITYNKSSLNMMNIAQNTMDINTLSMNTFTSLAVQSPGTGSYTGASSSNVVKMTPGSGISMSVDGTPSVVVATDYSTLVPTISNPTYAPTIATGVCAAPTCAKVSSIVGDSGPPTSTPTVSILGGTHATTTSSPTGITIDVNATSVCSQCPSEGSGGITNLTASVGGSTTASTVQIAAGNGISTAQSGGNTITIANTMSLSADVGGGTTADGADVYLTGGTGITTYRSVNTIILENDGVVDIVPTPTISVASPTPTTRALNLVTPVVRYDTVNPIIPKPNWQYNYFEDQPGCGAFLSEPRSTVSVCNPICVNGVTLCGIAGACAIVNTGGGNTQLPMLASAVVPAGKVILTATWSTKSLNENNPCREDGENNRYEAGISDLASACNAGTHTTHCKTEISFGGVGDNCVKNQEESPWMQLTCIVDSPVAWTPYAWFKIISIYTKDDNGQSPALITLDVYLEHFSYLQVDPKYA